VEMIEESNVQHLVRKYYKLSSEKEHPFGQCRLGEILLFGKYGEVKDEDTGIKLVQKAAERGCGPALTYYGEALLEGSFGLEKNPIHANKYLLKAKKDPFLSNFPKHHFTLLTTLGSMRYLGEGCLESPSGALRYYQEADKMKPGHLPQEMLSDLEAHAKSNGVEFQKEFNTRLRRLKPALVEADMLKSLIDWVKLWNFYGLRLSKEPTAAEAEVSMTREEVDSWMAQENITMTMLEKYPAMEEPLPPLQCSKKGCDVTEKTTGRGMKKCMMCRGPYCSLACQQSDWPRHHPHCTLVAAKIKQFVTTCDMEQLSGYMETVGLRTVTDNSEETDCVTSEEDEDKEQVASSLPDHHTLVAWDVQDTTEGVTAGEDENVWPEVD